MIKTSESIVNISKALLIFDAEVSKISKKETNPFFKNKYASLSDIQNSIREPLLAAKLTVKQFPINDCGLVTLIIHSETGEYIQSEYTMKPTKDDPQQHGSRLTYQRRYALGAVLGLNIDKDDDGNQASNQGHFKPVMTFETFEKAIKSDNIEALEKSLNAYKLNENQIKELKLRIANLKNY